MSTSEIKHVLLITSRVYCNFENQIPYTNTIPAQHHPKQRTKPAVRWAVRYGDDWHETWHVVMVVGSIFFLQQKEEVNIRELLI